MGFDTCDPKHRIPVNRVLAVLRSGEGRGSGMEEEEVGKKCERTEKAAVC
jgi:stringent starvation protein B